MKKVATISEIGDVHIFQVDDPYLTCITYTKLDNGVQFGYHDSAFKSEIFKNSEDAKDHLENSKTLAELFNLTGVENGNVN